MKTVEKFTKSFGNTLDKPDDRVKELRIKAFEEKRMTTHTPCNTYLFPKTPRTYGNPIPEICELPNPILNDLGKKLVGYFKIKIK